ARPSPSTITQATEESLSQALSARSSARIILCVRELSAEARVSLISPALPRFSKLISLPPPKSICIWFLPFMLAVKRQIYRVNPAQANRLGFEAFPVINDFDQITSFCPSGFSSFHCG